MGGTFYPATQKSIEEKATRFFLSSRNEKLEFGEEVEGKYEHPERGEKKIPSEVMKCKSQFQYEYFQSHHPSSMI